MNKHEPSASVAAVDKNLIAASASLFAPMETVPFNAASPPIFQTSLFTFDRKTCLPDARKTSSIRAVTILRWRNSNA